MQNSQIFKSLDECIIDYLNEIELYAHKYFKFIKY